MNTTQTPLFLMANLASEALQVFSFKKKGEDELAQEAVSRAEQILQKLQSFPEMQPRSPELQMLGEVIKDAAHPVQLFHVSEEQMHSFFQPFILRFFAINHG